MTTELATNQNTEGTTVLGTLDASKFEDRVAVFNAVSDADSLAELEDETFEAKAIVQRPSERVNPVTGEILPCTDTVFVTPDGHALFTKSDGIARSIKNLAPIVGPASNWPDGVLTFEVTTRDLGKGKTIKSVRIVA